MLSILIMNQRSSNITPKHTLNRLSTCQIPIQATLGKNTLTLLHSLPLLVIIFTSDYFNKPEKHGGRKGGKMLLPYQYQWVFFLHDWGLMWKLRFALAPAVAALALVRLAGGCLAALGFGAEVRVPAAPAGQWLHWEIAWGQRRCFQGWFYMHTCDLCLKWLYGKHPCPEDPLSNAADWCASLICSFFLLYFGYRCLRRGHVHITRWCWALSNYLVVPFSNW